MEFSDRNFSLETKLENEAIIIGDQKIPFEKYYPSKRLYSHTIEINTMENGDWLVPTFQKLHKSTIIEPGLYSSTNGKSTVNILSYNKNPPSINGKFYLKVNNFETITPIPMGHHDQIDKATLDKIIRTKHLSAIEKNILFDTILENQCVLLKPNEKLTATSVIKHKIITTDEEPVYTKSYRYPHIFKQDVEEQINDLNTREWNYLPLEESILIPNLGCPKEA